MSEIKKFQTFIRLYQSFFLVEYFLIKYFCYGPAWLGPARLSFFQISGTARWRPGLFAALAQPDHIIYVLLRLFENNLC